MHQNKTRQPGYLHHKPSNQAYVRINGRVHYLGRYQSADSHRRYANMMSDYRSGIPVEEHLSRARTRPLTVGEMAEQYFDHERDRFGPKNKQTYAAKYAMVALTEEHAGLRVTEFGPKALKRIQKALITSGYARGEVNGRVNRIRSAFKWAVSEELVDESVLRALQTVSPVSRGSARENPPREAVPETLVIQTVACLHQDGNHGAARLISFLMWTGCRPSEGCELTVSDLRLEHSQPRLELERHKTAKSTGKPRIIPLNDHAVQVINESLSELKTIQPDAAVFRSLRDGPFTSNGLYQAVRRTCRNHSIERWSPYQIRHLAATKLVNLGVCESAVAAMLGHTTDSKVVRQYSTDRFKIATSAAHALEGTGS